MATKKGIIGKSGCDMARGTLLIAAERLEALVGNACDANVDELKDGSWHDKTKAERAKELALVLKDIASAQAIIAEALSNQLLEV